MLVFCYYFLRSFPCAFLLAASSRLGQESSVPGERLELELQSRCKDDEGNGRAAAAGEQGKPSAEAQGAFGVWFLWFQRKSWVLAASFPPAANSCIPASNKIHVEIWGRIPFVASETARSALLVLESRGICKQLEVHLKPSAFACRGGVAQY